MDEQSLKTSFWQRVAIILVAVILLGATVLTYLFIVMNSSGSSSSSSSSSSSELETLMAEYDAKNQELNEAAIPLSDKYFPEFSKYQSRVKAYNAETATAAVLKTEDLKVGTGRTLAEDDTDYLAYYIGWCADGTIFDSSFDNRGNEAEQDATALTAPIDPSGGLIEGWEQGVIGMKLDGVREITMNGDLAYGDTQEICGGYNQPLKFIVLAIEPDETISKLNDELTDLYVELYMAYYGSASY